ncbi:MAG: nuclear transport factor 2 family protein [bacterium]|nr:nuclear transport factor 2 family protein [bacterium]
MTAQALADRDAIADLLRRYAAGVDARDLGAVAACFAPGAAYAGTLGAGTVADALPRLAAAMRRYTATMHRLGPQAIRVDGDRARATTDCLAHHVLAGGAQRTVAVTYDDALVRDAGGWRIVARHVTTRWARAEAAPHG